MGWIWRDEQNDVRGSSTGNDRGSAMSYRSSTRKVVTSRCKTEEIEPGKLVKKCEKTEEILRECVGKPVEVLQSNKEYTEEDVTDHILNKSPHPKDFDQGPINFPGLSSDIDAVERQFFGGINSFFNAAEEMSKAIFDTFGEEHPSSHSTPIEDSSRTEARRTNNCINNNSKVSGHIDLSGLARDV